MLKRYVPGQGTINIGVQDKVAIAVGETGPRGPPGPPGPATTIGATGPQGCIGEKGSPGPIGPKGDLGDTGPLGPTGPQGEIGPTGVQGPTGVEGIPGPKGETGPMGPQGPPGPATTIGATGSTGPVFPAAICFKNDMTRFYTKTITTDMKKFADFQSRVHSNWNYTSNAFLNGLFSLKFQQLNTNVTIHANIYINDIVVGKVITYTSGSGQIYFMSALPSLSVGDIIDIVFSAYCDTGTCLIVEVSSFSGAIYHVS